MFIMASKKFGDVDLKVYVDKDCDTHVDFNLNDVVNSEHSMCIRIEFSESTNWYPTVYVYDNNERNVHGHLGDCIHKYTFPKKFGVEFGSEE